MSSTGWSREPWAAAEQSFSVALSEKCLSYSLSHSSRTQVVGGPTLHTQDHCPRVSPKSSAILILACRPAIKNILIQQRGATPLVYLFTSVLGQFTNVLFFKISFFTQFTAWGHHFLFIIRGLPIESDLNIFLLQEHHCQAPLAVQILCNIVLHQCHHCQSDCDGDVGAV